MAPYNIAVTLLDIGTTATTLTTTTKQRSKRCSVPGGGKAPYTCGEGGRILTPAAMLEPTIFSQHASSMRGPVHDIHNTRHISRSLHEVQCSLDCSVAVCFRNVPSQDTWHESFNQDRYVGTEKTTNCERLRETLPTA